MAHKIYLTEGIILKKKDYGEADRLFWIYTEKFGMIMAVARSVRLEKSKLRYGLELFSLGNFAVISSGEFWRITDAKDVWLASAGAGLERFAKMAGFLLRMIKGQEKNEFIWQELKNLHQIFFSGGTVHKDVKNMEVGFMAKILRELGYMAAAPEKGNMAVSAINRAIKESML